MSKVLSTKLTVDEVDRFNSAAEQQGLSKAGLLKYLVKEYLSDSNRESKASNSCKLANNSSLEERQTPWKCTMESPVSDKQEVLQTGGLEKCLSHMHQPGRIKNVVHHVFADKTLLCSFSAAINSQGIASLAKVSDSREAITKKLSIEQGLLSVKAKTQAKPKTESGKPLLLGLLALWIASNWKRNSNQNILPEPNYSGCADYNEDVVIPYRGMGIPIGRPSNRRLIRSDGQS